MFILIAIVHFIAIKLINSSGLMTSLLDAQLDIEPLLILILIIFVAMSGVQSVVNTLVLAASARGVTLLATSLGTLTLVALTVLLIPSQGLIGVAVAMVFGQLITLLTLVSFLARWLSGVRVSS